jgi:putative ABC transport system ATP-binding protein
MGFTLDSVTYKGIISIDRLEIPGGKVTCVVGESGSGKTTLLRMLNNLVSPEKGAVYYKGENVANLDPVHLRRSVVMLPQNPVVFPGSVADNLMIALEFADKSLAKDEDLAGILETVMLQKKLSDDPTEFSGGEKQRLALARVLLLEPEALLLDEPSSALDERTEGEVIESVVNFARRRRLTLVMVIHSRELAERFADTLVTVKDGKVFTDKGGSRI